jgi:ufm1-conjugating enzyme 1
LAQTAGPLDGDRWIERLKEEYMVLIEYIKLNKEQDSDWFEIESNPDGTQWKGKCWLMHNFQRYEFALEFSIPAAYPQSPFDMVLPELDGKTHKMYRGGKICLDVHFAPLWLKNQPKFGIAHALAAGLGPWLASEIPALVSEGVI